MLDALKVSDSNFIFCNSTVAIWSNPVMLAKYEQANADSATHRAQTPEELQFTGGCGEHWPLYELFGKGPHAACFVNFISQVVEAAKMKHRRTGAIGATYLRIFCDNMPFFTPKLKNRLRDDPYPLHIPLTARDGISAHIIFKYRDTKGLDMMIPLLNLVDSEIWAFGQMMEARLPSGETLHQRLVARSSDSSIPEPTAEEIRTAFAGLKPKLVREYAGMWMGWQNTSRLRKI